MAGRLSDANDDGEKKGSEKDISMRLEHEESKEKDRDDKKPNSKETPSDRSPSMKKGSRTRTGENAPQLKGEGDQYASILPPPPTTANEQFPDRRKDGNGSGGRGGRRKPIRSAGTGRGNFVGPKMGDRKFKPRKGEKFRPSQDKMEDKKSKKKSLLPPKEDSSGLTSCDDFFSTNLQNTGETGNGNSNKKSKDKVGKRGNQDYFEKSLDEQIEKINDLPSTSYLFGNVSNDSSERNTLKDGVKNGTKGKTSGSPLPSLDGVLPVSELFYRSTQSISTQDNDDDDDDGGNDDSRRDARTEKQSYSNGEEETDDEELPFSAEQSDSIETRNNKIFMKRNKAVKASGDGPIDNGAQYKTDLAKLRTTAFPPPKMNNQNAGKKSRRKKVVAGNGRFQQRGNGQGRGRKMIRRGMEMLVGGEPINADPPLRFVELNYCLRTADALSEGLLLLKDKDSEEIDNDSAEDWASVVTTSSRDFGPLLHKSSVDKVSDASRQLYCEHFIKASIKWNVCPKDLKAIVKRHDIQKSSEYTQTYKDLIETVSSVKFEDPKSIDMKFEERRTGVEAEETKGFGKEAKKSRNKNTGSAVDFNAQRSASDSDTMNRAARRSNAKQESFTLGGELKFSLGVSRSELESGHDGESHGHILRRVFCKGIANAIKAESLGFQIVIAKMLLNEVDTDSTEFYVEFNMIPEDTMKYGEVEWASKKINAALAQAMDNGDMALAMGAAAKAETSWSAKVRARVVEEFLFDVEDELSDEDDTSIDDDGSPGGDGDCVLDDEDDFEAQREDEDIPLSNAKKQQIEEEFDGPFGMPGDPIYAKDDIYLGGGNGGVFPDYSENSKSSAPFSGDLGPLLLDAVTQRAIERQPRVIAIGDVHGCIDELQALLRRCDYRPGDLIVFLGDLVSKGPDSLAVVQMARELGAIGVRGNHDFEVIRWHQAIKSGADPPVIGSEHYQIASSLSKADLRWMYSLPWYLASKELDALFVHAGFVSGIRLGKQNPRLMMNMRSILPDGTVTSKFFNNWPWARLWDGPQTVLFGHDADRGLQQYEHAIGLDTGCVYGGRLTACILPEKRLVSVNAKREYFQYRRKHFD